jgi:hypothetical protein
MEVTVKAVKRFLHAFVSSIVSCSGDQRRIWRYIGATLICEEAIREGPWRLNLNSLELVTHATSAASEVLAS